MYIWSNLRLCVEVHIGLGQDNGSHQTSLDDIVVTCSDNSYGSYVEIAKERLKVWVD
jgi:hypothetical protein